MTMITYDLKVEFLATDDNRPRSIYLEMNWINRNTRPDFCEYFQLEETGENITMMTLRKKVKLQQFLDYHGHTFTEAIEKFGLLRLNNKRRLNNPHASLYPNIDTIEFFYKEIEKGNTPEYVDLACIEHY